MASQRIVLTSPWKLGLFVFLLVVGTAVGLVYAYMELFGASFDLNDEETLKKAYWVLGGVALLGLLGYIAVVTSARPLDRVVRGGRKREHMLKKFGGIQDPRSVDSDEFEEEPALVAVLDRWAAESAVASDAQLTIAAQREAMSQLVAQVRNAGPQGVDWNDDQANADLKPLVDAINECIQDTARGSAPANPGLDAPTSEAIADLLACEEELARGISAIGSGAGPVGGVSGARQQLEQLAEESNKLALTMALQVSRIGEPSSDLLDTAESLRSLSTRYQRLAADLRMVEQGTPAGNGGGSPDAQTLRQVFARMQRSFAVLRGVKRPAPTPAAPPSVPAPAAFTAEPPYTENVVADPTPPISTPVAEMAAEQGRIYEMAELGGRALDDEPRERVYDMHQFGAVEL